MEFKEVVNQKTACYLTYSVNQSVGSRDSELIGYGSPEKIYSRITHQLIPALRYKYFGLDYHPQASQYGRQ